MAHGAVTPANLKITSARHSPPSMRGTAAPDEQALTADQQQHRVTFPAHQLEGPIVTETSNNAAPNNQPAQICAASSERSIDDRLGEALRRIRHGLMRPLWADMPGDQKDGWINLAASVRATVFKDVGLKVEIER